MPELVERLDHASPTPVWRARTRNGDDVVAKRLEDIEPARRSDLMVQLRALHGADSAHLEPVAGAAEKGGELWVLLRPTPGLSLHRVLAEHTLSVAQATAIAVGILIGLEELHRLGLGHPRLSDRTVHVDALGDVRLSDCWLPSAPHADPRGEVQQAGVLACAALGIAPQPGESLTATERQAPALAATARSLAAGSAATAGTGLGLLADSAGLLGSPQRLIQTRRELADLVRPLIGPAGQAAGLLLQATPRPTPRPRPARAPAAVAIGPRPTRESAWAARPIPPGSHRPAWLVPAALGALGLLLLFLAGSAIASGQRYQNAGVGVRSPTSGRSAAPASAPAAPKPAVPAQPELPAAAGDVTAVNEIPQGPCNPGSGCSFQVDIHLHGLPQAGPVSYVIKVRDRCSGSVTETPGTTINAERGWILATGFANVQVPAGKAFDLVAQTTAPAAAASPPITIGSGC